MIDKLVFRVVRDEDNPDGLSGGWRIEAEINQDRKARVRTKKLDRVQFPHHVAQHLADNLNTFLRHEDAETRTARLERLATFLSAIIEKGM